MGSSFTISSVCTMRWPHLKIQLWFITTHRRLTPYLFHGQILACHIQLGVCHELCAKNFQQSFAGRNVCQQLGSVHPPDKSWYNHDHIGDKRKNNTNPKQIVWNKSTFLNRKSTTIYCPLTRCSWKEKIILTLPVLAVQVWRAHQISCDRSCPKKTGADHFDEEKGNNKLRAATLSCCAGNRPPP